jgi:deoxycytidine triphosphate deaminase
MSNTDKIPVGAVLSDTDIREMVKKFPDFITVEGRPIDFDDKEKDSLQPSCVDLRVGRIYMHGREFYSRNDRVELPPGALVHIESIERVTLHKHIMGFLVPKNSKSEAGLLFLNAGHVDPGWADGFMTAEVMNVTAGNFPMTIGEPLFSIVFQYVHTPATNPPRLEPDDIRRSKARQAMEARPRTGYEFYLESLKNEIARDYATKREAREEVFTRRNTVIAFAGLLLATFAAILGAVAIAVTIVN